MVLLFPKVPHVPRVNAKTWVNVGRLWREGQKPCRTMRKSWFFWLGLGNVSNVWGSMVVDTGEWFKLWGTRQQTSGATRHINPFSDLGQSQGSMLGFCYIVSKTKYCTISFILFTFTLYSWEDSDPSCFTNIVWNRLHSYTKIWFWQSNTSSCSHSYYSGSWSLVESGAVVYELQKPDPTSTDQLFLY